MGKTIEFEKVFVRQGVMVNTSFNGSNDLLYKLDDYSMPEG